MMKPIQREESKSGSDEKFINLSRAPKFFLKILEIARIFQNLTNYGRFHFK